LEIPTRYTLGAHERLKGRKKIEKLFKDGKAFSHFPFRVVYLFTEKKESSEWPLQAGFTVGVKHFKKAVDRNRIKRLMRETYRLQKQSLQATVQRSGKGFAVFFIYTGNELPQHALILRKMEDALARLLKIIDEKIVAHP
jgi:ribonuclease P protein component